MNRLLQLSSIVSNEIHDLLCFTCTTSLVFAPRSQPSCPQADTLKYQRRLADIRNLLRAHNKKDIDLAIAAC